jgi:hypothetical protein
MRCAGQSAEFRLGVGAHGSKSSRVRSGLRIPVVSRAARGTTRMPLSGCITSLLCWRIRL